MCRSLWVCVKEELFHSGYFSCLRYPLSGWTWQICDCHCFQWLEIWCGRERRKLWQTKKQQSEKDLSEGFGGGGDGVKSLLETENESREERRDAREREHEQGRGGEMRSQSVPADAHVGPQLQRDAVATLVCEPPPTPAPLIQIGGLVLRLCAKTPLLWRY